MQERFGLFIILASLLCLAELTMAVQTQNKKATAWFERGVMAKDVHTKIEAYTEAIQIDPDFVEANYNLAIVYKQLQNYPLTERFLKQAINSKSFNVLDDRTKTKIYFELAVTYESVYKFPESESAFLTAKKMSGSKQIRARISLGLGRVLSAQERFAEALNELQDGERLSSAYRNEYAKLIQSVEHAMQAESQLREFDELYVKAEKAMKSGDLVWAKSLFEQVKNASPGYRNVSAKIAEIDSQFQTDPRLITFQAIYGRARKHEADGQLELAAAIYQNLVQKYPGFQDVARRLANIRSTIDKNRTQKLVESEYAAGLAALKRKDWVIAIFAFEKVLEHDPNYLDTHKRLREAKRKLDRESTDSVVSRYYALGLLAMKKSNYAGAYVAFEKVRKINANYRNVASLIDEVETKLAEMHAAAAVAKNNAQIDSSRQKARTAIQNGDWLEAVVSLGILKTLLPDDEDVNQQFMQAQAKLKNNDRRLARAETSNSMGNYFTLGGAVAALLILPMIGIFVFSQTARARVYLLRGNYVAAAKIYEKILARNPGRVKLYPALANIYMLSGRHDEHALKVFQTVLQLNLPVQNRERIHSMLAQQYITGETTDGDTIDVLEKELQKEFARKKDDTGIN